MLLPLCTSCSFLPLVRTFSSFLDPANFIFTTHVVAMATRIISTSRFFPTHLFNSARPVSRSSRLQLSNSHLFSCSSPLHRTMASKVDSNLMSKMTEEEKKITGQDNPVKGGPTAQAQKHANQPLTSEVIHDITKGEEKITGDPNPTQSGPTSTAQSILTKVCVLTSLVSTTCSADILI